MRSKNMGISPIHMKPMGIGLRELIPYKLIVRTDKLVLYKLRSGQLDTDNLNSGQ